MNSPAKSPTSRSKDKTTSEEFAKWHCILHLFSEATEQDPFLAKYLKDAIDTSLSAEKSLEPTMANFAAAAFKLVKEDNSLAASYGFFHLDLGGRSFEPLFIRSELIRGLKKVAGYQTSLVLVTGLREAVMNKRQRFTAPCQKTYAEAKSYIDALATEWTTENTNLTVLYE
jgi:hypothetical protein